MAILDELSSKSRRWHARAERNADIVARAARIQAQQFGMKDLLTAARDVARLYELRSKQNDWRDFGDVAFHLVASWPPDLAHHMAYALRHVLSDTGRDPVPFIFKAVENLHYLNPARVVLHISMNDDVRKIMDDSEVRARRAARILAREISGTPLRWASGIFTNMEPRMRKYVADALREFNPEGAKVLLGRNRHYLLTWNGLRLTFFRVLFGKMDDHSEE